MRGLSPFRPAARRAPGFWVQGWRNHFGGIGCCAVFGWEIAEANFWAFSNCTNFDDGDFPVHGFDFHVQVRPFEIELFYLHEDAGRENLFHENLFWDDHDQFCFPHEILLRDDHEQF